MTAGAAIPVLSVVADGQCFGLAVGRVVHVLRAMEISPVPGAPAHIAGLINLRGHIVVSLDLRGILNQPERAPECAPAGVILETPTEQVCLLVDRIGDVIDLLPEEYFDTPGHIPPDWIPLAEGFYRQPGALLIKLNETALLSPGRVAA